MALDKDILGTALHTARSYYSNRTMDDLINEFGTLDNVRLALNKKEAEVYINHFKANAVVPALGLVAPNGNVTGSAKIT